MCPKSSRALACDPYVSAPIDQPSGLSEPWFEMTAYLHAASPPPEPTAVKRRCCPKEARSDLSPLLVRPCPLASAASVSGAAPLESVSVVSATDASQSTSTEPAAAGQIPASASLPSVPPLSPVTQNTTPSMSISERLEHALEKAAPLLREIFVDFAPFLSRTLLGSHGQELLIEGTSLVCMKSSSSVVELVMLLCSQSHCAQYAAEKREEEKMCDHLIRAAKYRDHVTSTQLIQKIVNILTDKHGAWGNSAKRGDVNTDVPAIEVGESPVNLSTTAHLVAPAVVVKGTLSVTSSELYFEVDDEEPSFKALDPKGFVLGYAYLKPAALAHRPSRALEHFLGPVSENVPLGFNPFVQNVR
ncbi:hypothetical protein WMY93_005856 [Mugilogobius chulae]|uniref:BEACH-type PH domain-containing protein n=1 Tax=Mugilogobius chulae TaxID=88201 RepID=A0AAW0PMF5_9GOBI